jgi:hypothetical protein
VSWTFGIHYDYVSHMISPALKTGTSTIIDANVSSGSYHSGLDPNGQATYSGSETVAVVHTERYDTLTVCNSDGADASGNEIHDHYYGTTHRDSSVTMGTHWVIGPDGSWQVKDTFNEATAHQDDLVDHGRRHCSLGRDGQE